MRSFLYKRKILYIILIVISVLTITGTSYAIFTVTTVQEGTNVIQTLKCLELTFSNQQNAINLENTYPMSDERGKKNIPYTFTLTNNCETYLEYSIGLKVNSESNLNNEYIKSIFSTSDYEDNIYLLSSRNIFKYNNEDVYLLKNDGLDNNQSENYALNLWLDESATQETSNKIFKGNIVLAITAKGKPDSNTNLNTYLFVDGNPTNEYPNENNYTYEVKCKDYNNDVFIENNFIVYNSGYQPVTKNLSNIYKYCDVNFYHNQSDFNLNYNKVSFIKGKGGEYIDTNYYPNPKSRIYVDAQYDDLTLQTRVFQASKDFYVDTYINGAGNYAFVYQDDKGNWINTKVKADYKRHTFDLDGYNKTYKIDNGSLYSASLSSYTATKTSVNFLKFFKTTGSEPLAILKIFEAKIYENGRIVKNYVPCIRNDDNMPGLYDLIGKTFVTSATGRFYSGVPEGYEQVNSIDANGNEYIDTGYYVSPNTRVFADAKFNDLTVQSRIFGTNSGLIYHSYINGAGNWAFAYQDNTGNWINSLVKADKIRHIFDLDGYNKKFKIDSGDLYEQSLETYNATITSKVPLVLFSTGTQSQRSKLTLYGIRIYENNVLQREYIPCYRKTDNVVGLFEIVTQTFITSPTGNLTITS